MNKNDMAKRVLTVTLTLALGVLVFVGTWHAMNTCTATWGEWVRLVRTNYCLVR